MGICDPSNPSRYYAVRGRVVRITTEGGAEHIETLAQRYLAARIHGREAVTKFVSC